jgi:hypothetical protein
MTLILFLIAAGVAYSAAGGTAHRRFREALPGEGIGKEMGAFALAVAWPATLPWLMGATELPCLPAAVAKELTNGEDGEASFEKPDGFEISCSYCSWTEHRLSLRGAQAAADDHAKAADHSTDLIRFSCGLEDLP